MTDQEMRQARCATCSARVEAASREGLDLLAEAHARETNHQQWWVRDDHVDRQEPESMFAFIVNGIHHGWFPDREQAEHQRAMYGGEVVPQDKEERAAVIEAAQRRRIKGFPEPRLVWTTEG